MKWNFPPFETMDSLTIHHPDREVSIDKIGENAEEKMDENQTTLKIIAEAEEEDYINRILGISDTSNKIIQKEKIEPEIDTHRLPTSSAFNVMELLGIKSEIDGMILYIRIFSDL